MRFLLDNNLSPRLVDLLHEHAHNVTHVRQLDLQAATDAEVMAAARDDARVLVSADTDFGTQLARSGATCPSLILIRRTRSRRAEQIADLLLANLAQVSGDLEAGAIVVLTDTDLRVRHLPLPPGH